MEELVYSPSEVAKLGIEYLQGRCLGEDEGVPIGIISLDSWFLPMRQGELLSILGRPRQGKTGLMLAWARGRAKYLRDIGDTKRAVVYVTYEQCVEELFTFLVASETDINVEDMARGNLDDGQIELVRGVAVQYASYPFWIMGHSSQDKKRRPKMTVNDIQSSLESMRTEYGRTIDIVFIDYLQRMPAVHARERRLEVSENVDCCKDLALTIPCPVVLGVQAGRQVDAKDFPMPDISDGQETANIEQASDKIIAVARPSTTVVEGEQFGDVVCKGVNHMLVAVRKQKMGRDNWMREVYYDPAHNDLRDWEDCSEVTGLGD